MVTEGSATSGIFIDLNGGPSHIDTFDPKPDAALRFGANLERLQPMSLEFAFRTAFPN